ncbi:hypothetical protein FACUT_4660 [Fusarium acutatum]|uniref:Uncharacterized protein n=1 Tax=Fusarium acutatum TaxID=78861 RepID=A0A8H4JUU8_9HYPO|nr:hypothetical protein FACUT_4660 [Fusarium acutatum]
MCLTSNSKAGISTSGSRVIRKHRALPAPIPAFTLSSTITLPNLTKPLVMIISHRHLEELSGGRGDGISLYIRWNDARLVVSLNHCPYTQACDTDDIEEAEALSDEILDAIVDAGRDIFDRLAPPPASSETSSQDLRTLLFPREYFFSLQTLDGKAEVLRKDSGVKQDAVLVVQSGLPFHLNIDKDCDLPMYSTKDIHVVEDLRTALNIFSAPSN